MIIQITPQLSLNPAMIASVYRDDRFYANGSATSLVITSRREGLPDRARLWRRRLRDREEDQQGDGMTRIPRYEWRVVDSLFGHEDDLDQICVDRLTGDIVVRYDLGDPANWDPEYGGASKREYLERKGLDPDTRIDAALARNIS